MPNWIENVRHITDGEPVDAAVASRPDRDNEGNARYLRDRLDAAALGSMDAAFSVTVAPEVQVGSAVYYNPAASRFEPALAAVADDPASGVLLSAPSSDCLGVCSYKHAADLADVVLHGRAAIDLAASAGPDAAPGRYYLSSSTPGALTPQAPAVSVPVLFLASDGFSYVNPLPRNFLTEHVHFRVDLVCAPAGSTSPPSAGQRHVVGSPDPSLPGWLPAAHASFGGRAPAGAAWGYNLAQHPQLRKLWPPIPVGACSLFWDKGAAHLGATMVPMGPSGLAQVDSAGIWWMTDCYGDVPWPTGYDSSAPPGPPADGTTPPTCPRPESMRLSIHFAVSQFASKFGIVTSLVSSSPALVVEGADGVAARSGNLRVRLELDLAVDDDLQAGSTVLKTFQGGVFGRGRVLEGLTIGPGLTATADHVDTAAPDAPVYQGLVHIEADPTPADRELAPQLVRQAGVSDQVYAGLPFILFPGGSQSSALYLCFDVPTDARVGSPKLTLLAWVLGTTNGTLPPLTAAYRRIARPASGSAAALPTTDVGLAFTTGQTVAAYSYREVMSPAFAVSSGDKVLVTISRGGGDGYGGGVGLLRYSCILGS